MYRVRQKEHPDLGGDSFGWGARTVVGSASSNSGYVPFSVYTMACLEKHRAFIVQEFIKNGGSPVATQRAFRFRFALGRREAVPDKKTIYRWVSNFRQTGQTLEALKQAIRQEVAAITPEMILKFMDNYRERLQDFINIQGRHLSDVLFKTLIKTAFYALSRNRKKHFRIFFGFEFICFSNRGVLSAAPVYINVCID